MTNNQKILIIKKTSWGGVTLPYELTQLLKGLCCVMIALHHYSQYMIAEGLSSSLFYQLFSTQGGYAGVAMFFFLSGFGLMESESKRHLNIWEFIVKRFWKVYKAVLVINIIHYGTILCWDYCNTGTWVAIDWSILFSIAKLDYHFWFIEVLFTCYVGFAIATQIRNNNIRNIAIVVGQILVFAFWMFKGESINHLVSMPLFVVGIYVSLFKEKSSRIINNLLLWIGLAFITGFVCYWTYQTRDAMPVHTVANVLMIAGLLWIVARYEIVLRFRSFLGYISFPIYLVHWKVMHLSSSLGYIAPLWLFLLLTVYLAYLLQKTIEISLPKIKKQHES